ncbi:hypothetical protein MYXO_02260 [Myxococcaceae bacterium]|jgi:LPS export ABC transporter protein LptC|nr:hypothetical protein MYXO_02260 [Myxococcaceae bacterium]
MPSLRVPRSRLLLAFAAFAISMLGPVAQSRAAVAAAGLEIRGMTFVQSEGGTAEMVVEAERGRLDPETRIVHLEQVRTRVSGNREREGFEMTCDRGELALDDHRLYASGNVRGRTADGRAFSTTWVRYDPERELAFTDAPVQIEDGGGRLAGGGFRYYIREGRFHFPGGASVRRETAP